MLCDRSCSFAPWFGPTGTILVSLERSSEPIDAVLPELAVLGEPRIELAEWLGPECVEPALSIGAHRDEARIVEDAQVARDAGLMDARPRDNVADLLLAASQHLDDATPRRVREGLKGV